MFNNARQGLMILGLMLPLITQAQICNSVSESEGVRGGCDVTFSAIPNFGNLCVGTILGGTYTITNNSPVFLKINYIRIQNYDALPNEAAVIAAAPLSCGSYIAPGASCNILLNLQPVAFGNFYRVLQIGINSRQLELDAPVITSAVNCITPPPVIPPTPTSPFFPTPPPPSQFLVSILGATTVTNAGLSVVNGDVDVSPGSAITGFPPGTVLNGAFHAADATAAAAHNEAQAYYNSAVSLPCPPGNNLTGLDLGGRVLPPGVYCFNSSAQLTGALVLSGGPTSSYVFQIGSTLTTASNASVVLQGGVTNGNVTWAVGSSATIGTGTAFAGIIDAVASITLTNSASLRGRAWALNGAVTLDTNIVNPTS
ncbi:MULTISPECIES: ice-binding family protein [Legionella]|uniref:DUF3494 domain-containing protein n=1 Tax=Legionella drozanskii LLAP-1 TaxID=1212489 RepID=A0A0W0SRX1_9GAMM|nr:MULTISPECIES: ice-binding family protein [Legionella]KTC85717.1 hypothetical protein Ldro_2042 [Legionella drozanskii LLAP-1]PJE11475.1 MAG: DUF3494 domain-containing protein [Legionella sp.]